MLSDNGGSHTPRHNKERERKGEREYETERVRDRDREKERRPSRQITQLDTSERITKDAMHLQHTVWQNRCDEID